MKQLFLIFLALFGTLALAEDFTVKHETGTVAVTPPIDGLRTVVVVVKDKGSDAEAVKDAIKELDVKLLKELDATRLQKTSKAEVVVDEVLAPAPAPVAKTTQIQVPATYTQVVAQVPVATCTTGKCGVVSQCVSQSSFTGYWRDGAPYILPNTSRVEVEKAPGFVSWDTDGTPVFRDGQVPIGISARIVPAGSKVPDIQSSTCTTCKKVVWRQLDENTWKAEEGQ